jgi:hypothetical protein
MRENLIRRSIAICALFLPWAAHAAPVAVRHPEGLLRGFLVLSSTDGTALAEGDMTQFSAGDRVTNRLVFRFKDGSLHDETVVFAQRSSFRLLTYHLIQKGPSFHGSSELSFDSSSGMVTVRYADGDGKKGNGKEKMETEHLEIPPDVANGMLLTLLRNIKPDTPLTMLSMLAATPKPRLVKLAVTPGGEDPFTLAGTKQAATRFVVKVEIGGIEGALAKLLKKQPPDIQIWVLGGEAPAFVKMEGPLYYGGPIWRIELTSPVWPGTISQRSKK